LILGNKNLVRYKCPFCSCDFATGSDLNSHLHAWENDKQNHIQLLDKAHREIDVSFKGTMAKRKGKRTHQLPKLIINFIGFEFNEQMSEKSHI